MTEEEDLVHRMIADETITFDEFVQRYFVRAIPSSLQLILERSSYIQDIGIYLPADSEIKIKEDFIPKSLTEPASLTGDICVTDPKKVVIFHFIVTITLSTVSTLSSIDIQLLVPDIL